MCIPIDEKTGSQSNGGAVTELAMATRVTLTAVPRIVNDQTGAIAWPRLVWIGAEISVASVAVRSTQSSQVVGAVCSIATMASCAEITATVVVVPSGQRTSPSFRAAPLSSAI